MLALYQQSARKCPGLPWTVLAGIGHVESDHGRMVVKPADGAAGPMQILPKIWSSYAIDGNHDGTSDITDPADAVPTVSRFLCANGAGHPADLRRALIAYNNADWFVSAVVAEAARYANIPVLAGAPLVGAYSLPVNPLILAADPALMSAPHHDFPAWDLPVPIGTPVYAVTSGRLVASGGTCGDGLLLLGDDGFTYQYCHGSQVLLPEGARVVAGELIMLSGNTGASTGPHLHFGIMRDGVNLCPQPIIRAWFEGVGVSPAEAPTTGCTYPS
jgi:murein DD-endopeptidase MepM/ murein hydrolase activator NlpD